MLGFWSYLWTRTLSGDKLTTSAAHMGVLSSQPGDVMTDAGDHMAANKKNDYKQESLLINVSQNKSQRS